MNDKKLINDLLDSLILKLKGRSLNQEEHSEIISKIMTLITHIKR